MPTDESRDTRPRAEVRLYGFRDMPADRQADKHTLTAIFLTLSAG